MGLSEFQLIKRYFTRTTRRDDVALSVGDDAALLRCRPGMELAIAVDTLVAGVHFPVDTPPEDIGYKALAVNLSDMAAMGAEPAWATLALTLPNNDDAWIERFASGFFALAEQHNVALIGGDTTRGPLTVTVQIHGWVPQGRAMRRAGARVGDAIFVSGTLGDAGIGLACAQGRLHLARDDRDYCIGRLNRPTPRVALGVALREFVHAAIDVSDGFSADLSHVLGAGGIGARVELSALPLSSAMRKLRDEHALPRTAETSGACQWSPVYDYALSAGDDYELIMVAASAHADKMMHVAREMACPITRVGVIEAEQGLRIVDSDGVTRDFSPTGFKHF